MATASERTRFGQPDGPDPSAAGKLSKEGRERSKLQRRIRELEQGILESKSGYAKVRYLEQLRHLQEQLNPPAPVATAPHDPAEILRRSFELADPATIAAAIRAAGEDKLIAALRLLDSEEESDGPVD